MIINVIFPTTEEGKEILYRALYKAHLDMVVKNLNKLNIPYEQKLKLFDAVCDKIERQCK